MDNCYRYTLLIVRWRLENGNYTSRTVEGSKSYEILDTIAGNYQIEVYSVSASGLRSTLPTTTTKSISLLQ